MARKGDGTFENLTRAPWPVGLVFGVIFFAVIRYGIPAYFEHSASPILAKVGASLGPAITPLAWVVLIGSWLASGVGRVSHDGGQSKRKRIGA